MSKNKDNKKSWKDDKKEIKDKKLKETSGGHYPEGKPVSPSGDKSGQQIFGG